MLARTFKTAADLGLNEIEYEALVETLYRMESGKIKRSEICMRVFMEVATCGTIACIAGWANAIDPRAFPELQDRTNVMQFIRKGAAGAGQGVRPAILSFFSYRWRVQHAGCHPGAGGQVPAALSGNRRVQRWSNHHHVMCQGRFAGATKQIFLDVIS